MFEYTKTPEVQSGIFHFRICDLVVPDTTELFLQESADNKTRFVLPFDNPDKPKGTACAEIEKALRSLEDGTLLFLKNIRKIEYTLPDRNRGSLERIDIGENRINIQLRHPDCPDTVSIFYLRFEKQVSVHDEDGSMKPCRIAVVFGLEQTQDKGLNVKLLESGHVCIYFPAIKERSDLKFHLHAPFAATVARDSVRDCEENDELRDELAELIAASMTIIRDQKLLTVDSLSVLPNSEEDSLVPFYEPIMKRLVEEFRNKDLVPMQQGGHAAAIGVFQDKDQLSNLISDWDLAMILGGRSCPPLWVVRTQQNRRVTNFLRMLNITEWSVGDIVMALTEQYDRMPDWMTDKPVEWHQQLYAVLAGFLEKLPKSRSQPGYSWSNRYVEPYEYHKERLSNVPIVRLSDGTYRKGKDCYFPSDGVEYDEEFPRVAPGVVFTYGDDETQQREARRFLAEIGVKELDESHRVEAILKERYTDEDAGLTDENQYLKDLKRFVRLVGEDPDQSDLLQSYRIFWSEDEKWRTPVESYVDLPVIDTGLRAYFEALTDKPHRRWALVQFYETCGLEFEMFREFAEAVGVQTKLKVTKQEIPWAHPERRKLKDFPGSRRTYTGTDYDYDIEEFVIMLEQPATEKARLIWRTMCSLPDKCLDARYSPNQQCDVKIGASSLVHSLRNAAWVPQDNEHGLSFTAPRDARVESLQAGFPYERGRKWLEAIEFGNNPNPMAEATPHLEQAATEYLGTDQEGLTRAQKFLQLSPERQQEVLDEAHPKESNQALQAPAQSQFPQRSSADSERRTSRVAAEYENAPDKEYETRDRSVRTSRVEIDRETFLRNCYTNNDEFMICQICEKEMPFKKRDGEYYFEAVEALSKSYFPKEQEAQFLALCPLCAAMYKELIKRDEPAMQELFRAMRESTAPVIPIRLGECDTSIQFVETHWQEIKTILSKVPSVNEPMQ